ncbi:transcriptional regulator, TetR family [Faunimonas pinastri]|uniref:Transcriptional regulator, TetR family n=1 Tax=Faunimonas pinastri TaxID=1855383 RepID=A0A1H9HRD1_9HYPH|nr:TetR/AcrR family transcriptional regulator [Faunimonas pinastri]SEQ64828.1 transcriptional regulator, TetR family [Faunimonas pinastri]
MVQRIENARERFGKAAIELFRTRGYASTTVPQIAAAAGLTERTFFRYFIDKPEVLFWRANEFEAEMVRAINQAADAQPLDIVIRALEAVGCFFDDNRADVLARQAVVAAHVDFQERELMKMRSLGMAICAALTDRSIEGKAARMAAETGIVIWRVAIERWSEDPASGFVHHVRACTEDLATVVTR